MKTIFILFIFAVPVLSQSFSIITCPTKIAKALSGDCQRRLQERLDIVNNAESDMNTSAPSIFRCCYYAEYLHCVAEEARPECGDDVANMVEKQTPEKLQFFFKNCKDKSYYSATCIFVVWFNLIVIGSIVLGILLIGCCIGIWCCR